MFKRGEVKSTPTFPPLCTMVEKKDSLGKSCHKRQMVTPLEKVLGPLSANRCHGGHLGPHSFYPFPVERGGLFFPYWSLERLNDGDFLSVHFTSMGSAESYG
ncbi:hypothetical protein AVEN_142260-1 [Araneus ventricosus]|uniref:Uncharacterized protein n=1 Tax=Araneus ventricosus TaxID=182803 RepID=A0A4Y2FFJ0_ARAVE|nr:hypothetical protein AVEN_142260-1 [Araneus ventricosus]